MAFNASNPPTSITTNSFVFDVLNYVFVCLGLVTMLLYFRRRGQASTNFNASTEKEGTPFENKEKEVRGLMTLNESEYKVYLAQRRAARRGGK